MSEDIDIGAISEVLNEKVDRDWNNLILPNDMGSKLNTNGVRTITESYVSGTEWYRLWSDGWIEQGGSCASGGSKTVTFLKPFSNTNYTALATSIGTNGEIYAQCIKKTSASQITIYNSGGSSSLSKSWYACGY